jgi:hypothetical protein
VKILQSASESVTQFTKKFRRGEGAQVVTPARLAEALRGADIHESLGNIFREELVQRCELAMQRFVKEDKTLLQEEQLDAWSRQIWSGMSFKSKLWRGTQPLAVMTAPLLAAILVPFDAGGTAVLVFASAKELLAAAGVAAVVTPMATGGEALQIVQQEAPWRQLSDLFAILCDSLGLPRPEENQLPCSLCNGTRRRLLVSKVQAAPATARPALSIWEANAESLEQLQVLVRRMAHHD